MIMESSLKPGLYCVATPIGNLKDITYRAVETLKACDIIACEDTRQSAKLLSHYGLHKKLLAYHDHNGEKMRPKLISLIEKGKSVALISDAGMPLINDPGVKLVRECREKDLYVTVLPGASAVPCALVLSGLMTQSFSFLGFFDEKLCEDWQHIPSTLVFFESPRRLVETLSIIKQKLSNREVAIVREISKIYEQTIWGNIDTVMEHFSLQEPKGEIVIVLGPLKQSSAQIDELVEEQLRNAMQHMSFKDAVESVSTSQGISKKLVYKIGLSLKNSASPQ